MKTGIVRELEQFVTTFHNPEVAAMAAIGQIHEELPDAAARLRVMRWAFAKYSEEFKRPLPDAPAAVAAARVAGPVLVVSTPRPAAPPAVIPMAERSVASDFQDQIAELNDLFPERTPATLEV